MIIFNLCVSLYLFVLLAHIMSQSAIEAQPLVTVWRRFPQRSSESEYTDKNTHFNQIFNFFYSIGITIYVRFPKTQQIGTSNYK